MCVHLIFDEATRDFYNFQETQYNCSNKVLGKPNKDDSFFTKVLYSPMAKHSLATALLLLMHWPLFVKRYICIQA